MTRHLCTGCHGGWRSARCRPRHGASCIGLEDTPWPSWRTKTVWAAPRWRSALKVAPRRRMRTLTAPRRCHVTELAPRRCKAVWAAPRWCSALRIAPRWRTCTLAAPRWRFATELAPRRHRAAPRWCPATEPAPCRRRAVGARATVAHCPGGCAATAYLYVGCTTAAPCH